MAARFEVYDKNGWRWKLIDGKNVTVATSEPYASAANARRGAENVRRTAPSAPIPQQ